MIIPSPSPPHSTDNYSSSSTYLLVHGAWHGAWCWYKVVPLLEAAGQRVVAFDLPSHGADTTPAATVTLADYVQKVVAVALAQPGPVVLVGHSLAGIVIAQAAEQLGPEKVASLVFIEAFMPWDGESALMLATQAGAYNQAAGLVPFHPALTEILQFSADYTTSLPQFDQVDQLLYQDCSAADIAWAKANLSWQAMSCLTAPVQVTAARYGAIPKGYILGTEARDLDKRSLARHILCEQVVALASGHSPFFSMPEQLVEAIQKCALPILVE